MNADRQYTKDALTVLKETSRTFFVPISKLKGDPKDAVASAYLCLRAIDEIEDHFEIPNEEKVVLLRKVSMKLQEFHAQSTIEDLTPEWGKYEDKLPEVTKRIGEWILYAPAVFQGRIVDATSAMSDRMANWCAIGFAINSIKDLDGYTFSVAGSVGLLLSDIWAHYDNCKTDRSLSIAFGRGLQSVNIIRNQLEDKKRGVTWYPPNYSNEDMFDYAETNLSKAKEYMKSLPKGSSALLFCRIPLNLAIATLQVMRKGQEKLTRKEVVDICEEAETQNNQELAEVEKKNDEDFLVSTVKMVQDDQVKFKKALAEDGHESKSD